VTPVVRDVSGTVWSSIFAALTVVALLVFVFERELVAKPTGRRLCTEAVQRRGRSCSRSTSASRIASEPSSIQWTSSREIASGRRSAVAGVSRLVSVAGGAYK
jgi:hypothetical protein